MYGQTLQQSWCMDYLNRQLLTDRRKGGEKAAGDTPDNHRKLWKKPKADASPVGVAADPSGTLPFAAAGGTDASFAVAAVAAAMGGVADTLAAAAAEDQCTSSLTGSEFKPWGRNQDCLMFMKM
ncbi:hypothetical protein L1987_83340 [Smallanthus sonchifolius]|uniref:Uncharacterized protein n=1 Tax=Smallanthus sonchifolius TaxID=185202 RepID=A0ACB8YB68_9ASTR|nr:hypothetical protein L1987_83340 [Smallanthus sonchifolius]